MFISAGTTHALFLRKMLDFGLLPLFHIGAPRKDMLRKPLDPGIIAFFSELAKPEYSPIRSRGEELEMIRQYQGSRDNACVVPAPFHVLVKRNLRYVASISRKYMSGDGHDIDVFHAGVLGLMAAINKYNISSNCKLITYARDQIKHGIVKYIRSKPSVRLTNHISWNLRKVSAALDGMAKSGRLHTDEAVSSATGLSMASVGAARRAKKTQCVVDHFPGGYWTPAPAMVNFSVGREADSHTCPNPIDALVKNENIGRLRNALDLLPKDEALVIRRRYLDHCPRESYRSLAKAMGCSHEQVRKIEMRAFDNIAVAFATAPDEVAWSVEAKGLLERIERFESQAVDYQSGGTVPSNN